MATKFWANPTLEPKIITNLSELKKLADVLAEQFRLKQYEVVIQKSEVDLKYFNGFPVIKEIKRVSKPGRRIYAKATSISKIQNGLGLAIVSTSKGVMSDNDARTKKVGGEIICRVF